MLVDTSMIPFYEYTSNTSQHCLRDETDFPHFEDEMNHFAFGVFDAVRHLKNVKHEIRFYITYRYSSTVNVQWFLTHWLYVPEQALGAHDVSHSKFELQECVTVAVVANPQLGMNCNNSFPAFGRDIYLQSA